MKFGSVKNLSSGGVGFSRGRGAGRTTLEISAGEIAAWAKKNSALMPGIVRRSMGSAAGILRGQLRKVMRSGGGAFGVPLFAPYDGFTVSYRDVFGKRGKMGGVLAESKRIVMYRRGEYQVIGWPDAMERLANSFQEGRGGAAATAWLNSRPVRAALHRRGIDEIPTAYSGRRRDVMATFSRHIDSNLRSWRAGVLNKNIAKELARSKGWAK